MRRSLALILSTATLGTMVAATGCAEHRYPAPGPYYSPYDSTYYGYNGWDAAEQARYREWLAERRYGYVDFNRLAAERQREYWEWRNARYPGSVQQQYRDYNRQRTGQPYRDYDHDRAAQQYRDYNRQRAEQRYRDYDRQRVDRERAARGRDDRNRAYQNHSRDRDQGRRHSDRDHDHDHR